MAAANTFLSLLHSPPHILAALHHEAASVFPTPQSWALPTALPRLILADSAIRESLRLYPLLSRTLIREVAVSQGLDMPGGHHLAQGARIGIAALRVNTDERFYVGAGEYDAFRFARGQLQKEQQEKEEGAVGPASAHGAGKDVNVTTNMTAAVNNDESRLGLTTATNTFLSWGYGRHTW